MSFGPSYAIRKISVDSVTWTALSPPIDASYFSLKNTLSVNLKERTDSADPNTENTLEPNAQETVTSTLPRSTSSRFNAGETVLYMQAASGSGTVTVTWVK